MELRKQGKIKERETYEQYGDTNRGIVIPQVPFGNAKYDNGERFDLRLPYVVRFIEWIVPACREDTTPHPQTGLGG